MKKSIKVNHIIFLLSAAIIGLFVVMAIVPGLFTNLDPAAQDVSALLKAPGKEHLFGTDNFGRDIYARVIYAARADISIGIFAMLIPLFFGTLIGLVTGYYGGKIDAIVMRIVDLFTIFPFMILVIMIVAVMGTGLRNVFLAIWFVGWKEYTRIVRSEVLVEKNKEYVLAAKTLGYSDARIIFGHILPNVINTAIIYGTSDIIICMMAGAALGFLGLGVQPPNAEWGLMIADGKGYMSQAPWMSVAPGIVMVVAGVSFTLFGDGLADYLRKSER